MKSTLKIELKKAFQNKLFWITLVVEGENREKGLVYAFIYVPDKKAACHSAECRKLIFDERPVIKKVHTAKAVRTFLCKFTSML